MRTLLFVIATLGLAACSAGSEEPTPKATPTPAATPTAAPTAKASPTPTSTPVPTPPSDTTLIAGGYVFGFCIGDCRFELTFSAPDVRLQVSDPPAANIAAVNDGRLTAVGLGRLGQVRSSLSGQTLLSTYGCPGCLDGGVSYVDILRDGISHHEYEYALPPTVLQVTDAFVHDLILALRSCTPSVDITIVPGCTPVN
jgi:hypothetical protein